jgi:hypothetical protein
VQRLSLQSEAEWWEWVQDNKPGITSRFEWLLPDEPQAAYDEWVSWEDWLGRPLGYEEAREVVSGLGVRSQQQWWAFTREQADELIELRVPSRPHLYYANEWRGYDHWLSLPEQPPLVLPRDWPTS